jgi:hypothetical protein
MAGPPGSYDNPIHLRKNQEVYGAFHTSYVINKGHLKLAFIGTNESDTVTVEPGRNWENITVKDGAGIFLVLTGSHHDTINIGLPSFGNATYVGINDFDLSDKLILPHGSYASPQAAFKAIYHIDSNRMGLSLPSGSGGGGPGSVIFSGSHIAPWNIKIA